MDASAGFSVNFWPLEQIISFSTIPIGGAVAPLARTLPSRARGAATIRRQPALGRRPTIASPAECRPGADFAARLPRAQPVSDFLARRKAAKVLAYVYLQEQSASTARQSMMLDKPGRIATNPVKSAKRQRWLFS
jgi:hypothetical protein